MRSIIAMEWCAVRQRAPTAHFVRSPTPSRSRRANVPAVVECPSCNGRRLRATREERDHSVDGALYTGFVKVTVCKTCRAVHKDKQEEEAFVRDVELVAANSAPERAEPRKIHRRR
jgi:hypothetical protein